MKAVAKSVGSRQRPFAADAAVPEGGLGPGADIHLSAAQLNGLIAASGPAGPVNAGAPGSIIPALPTAPSTPNWTSAIIVGNEPYVQAAGTYLYSNQSSTMISGNYYYNAPLINDGLLWMDGSLAPNLHSPHIQYVIVGGTNIVNHGTAVLLAHDDAPRVGQSDAFTFANFYQLENTGQIFAWAEAGRAFALWSENYPGIVNSGLVAAYVEAGLATAIVLENGGGIVNQAGGRILAEAPVATAISYYNANLPSGWAGNVQVTNAGTIQAASTNSNYASTALSFAHISFQVVRVVNSGTIRADVAIIDVSSSEGQYSPVQASVQIVTNQAGGLIAGDILLDRGNDELYNSGTITGYVLLGEGDDRFDTAAGVTTGLIDLGWGADAFKGSAGADYVAGNDGNDLMEGNGGNDQLMGGANDDVLIGGAGNDGLFGEYGNDRIVTQGGDFVWAGFGNDRIELGDYAFELVSGNEGYDVLVLPSGGRVLDLSAALAAQAIQGIEEIVLGGGKEIVIRAADIPLIAAGAATLRINGIATDKIDLVGAWAAAGTVTIDAISYRQYQLAGQSVLVQGAANVVVGATPPAGAGGLDPVAGGGLAPIPGEGPLDLTPDDKYLVGYVLTQSTMVSPEQLWWNDLGAPVLHSSGHGLITLTNYGHILSWGDSNSVGGPLGEIGLLDNYGTVTAQWAWDNSSNYAELDLGGVTGVAYGAALNHALIEALALHGGAVAAYRTTTLTNLGMLHAFSEHGWAVGAWEVDILDNRGTILAEGAVGATGVRYFGGDGNANAGRIEAHVTGGGAESIGAELRLLYYDSPFHFTNSGAIVADIAVMEEQSLYSGYRPVWVINTGMLDGRIELGRSADRVDNDGTITGDTLLFDGNDLFDGSGGVQLGAVRGGGGNDVLIGGGGADILVGGAGADRLIGGGGADRFVFEAIGDSREEALRSDGAKSMSDIIAGFVSGVDRIDLSAIDAVAGTIGDDRFTFIGASAFTGHAGELRYDAKGGQLHLYADVDGNGAADFRLTVQTDLIQATDFVL